MARANVSQQNFAGGELSPKLRGRWDLPIYTSGCEKILNFIAETQGPAKFRTGGRFVHNTRRNQIARFQEFQFNDEQAYVLEFTDKFIRFYKDEAIIVEGDITITGITQADPAVVTAPSHGFSSGDEIFIFGVVGMTEVNARSFIINVTGANDFELQDQDEVDIDSTLFTAYASDGISQKIVEVASPYLERHLFDLKFSQNADTSYITHPFYEPRKLTRTSNINWTLNIFARTADPFTDQMTITDITQANPGVVTATAHGYSDGDFVVIETVVGMTEVNGVIFIVTNSNVNDFELNDIDNVPVDTTGFTAYGSAGYTTIQRILPGASAFYEGRLAYARTDLEPDTFWMSRSPDENGEVRYDDFTTGTDADHSIKNTIASKEGNVIFWLAPTDRLLAIGTFGSTFKATGGGNIEEAITPTNISVRPVDFVGAASIEPIFHENILIYVQRGRRTLRSFEFDTLNESFISVDRNLVADHITVGSLKQMALQAGRPDVFWAIKEDGELLGLTFKSREDVSGWHRHMTGGTDAKYITIAVMFQESNFDQIWYVAERVINGSIRRHVEFFEDEPEIPEFDDFFTGENDREVNDITFRNAMFEAQKQYVHLDSVLTFDGLAPGSAAGATMTPAAVSGTGITFTASAPVFSALDVGREIWKKSINGVGVGRATINIFNSTTSVDCTIPVDFDNTDVMAAGDWYLTTDSITGLDHLEGELVGIVTDGSIHPDGTVTNGAVSLDYQASKIHIGLKYVGFIKTMSIEAAATIGPAQTKSMNVDRVNIRFFQTLGASFGTDLYSMEDILFRSSADFTNRPPPLFSGDKPLQYSDDWTDSGKHVYIQQRQPLPCIVQMLVPFVTTSNE